jgi:hypothetical protein
MAEDRRGRGRRRKRKRKRKGLERQIRNEQLHWTLTEL